MKRGAFTQEFKRQAVLLSLNEGIPGQSVSKKLGIHLIPSTDKFKNIKNTKNVLFREEGAMNSFVEMKLRASKKRINV